MKPFKFLEPKTLKEACSMLSQYKEEARLIAGGQSLVPMLKHRLIDPKYIIDLKGIADLSYIKEDKDGLRIGALTSQRDVETSAIVKKRFLVLAEAEHSVGAVQIRNWGTIGGSLAEADPSGDPAPALIALGGRIKATSTRGQREIALEDFFIDYLENALEADEILSEIILPYPAAKSGGSYVKEVVRVGDTGIASVAVVVTLNGQDKVKEARIVLGAQASTPIRAKGAEKAAVGKGAGDDMEDVGEAVAREANPAPDVLGSVEYKTGLSKVITKRALETAINRAKS